MSRRCALEPGDIVEDSEHVFVVVSEQYKHLHFDVVDVLCLASPFEDELYVEGEVLDCYDVDSLVAVVRFREHAR